MQIYQHNQLTRTYQQSILALAMSVLLVACGPQTPMGEAVNPSPTPREPAPNPPPTWSTITLEALLSVIEPKLRYGDFAAIYSGVYVADTRIIVLVTERQQAVQEFLVKEGVPASAVEVRLVNASLERLQQADTAGQRWLAQFPGAGGVAIDVPRNRLVISVEREPLIKLINYDPGNEPVPYIRWPKALQQELAGIVPDVGVELRAGFTTTVPNVSATPETIP